VSLGVTFVFFVGILAGHFGLSVDPQMLNYAESFGLVIFVYALGLQVGPGFFSSLSKGGITLNILAMGVVVLGTLLTLICSLTTGVSLPDMVGILCGATTNTPALGAAQQTLKQMGMESSTPALGCAVAYPLGVVGVILSILLIRKLLVRKRDLELKVKDDNNNTYIAAFQVHNPAIFNKSIKDIAHMSYPKFVISRLWREGKVSIPTSEKILKEGDRLLVVASEKDAMILTVLFGEQENTDWNKEDIDWNAIDSQLISQRIVVTRPELNGRKLGSLRLRNHYGINISRVYRSGVQLLATPELTLQLGDRLTVVGEAAAIQNVEKVLGNAIKSLKEPNLVAVFVGIIAGLALGAIPITIPGISTPVRLGLAGGPIIVGILIGTFGPRMHMITYTTRSANLMLRALGLSMYLACLGLDAGAHFFDTVFRPEGLLWIGLGAGLTIIPTVVVGVVAFKFLKIDFGTVSGMLCGSMANPMALNYANDTIPGDNPSVAYATVYPLCMFLRVIIRHTTRIACRCTQPKNIMVSPLDIEIMIIAQRVHNDMRTGAAVINISDNMQRVDGQPLDQLTHGYNEGIGTFRTDYGTDDNIDVSMFIGFYTRLVEQLLYDV
jgi:AspT/YidE/YbjL antiporter-like protein